MKSITPENLCKKNVIERIVDAVTLHTWRCRLGHWIDHEIFKIDVYKLKGDEIIRGRRPLLQFNVQDVVTWQQIFICLGVPVVVIKFSDGRITELSDKHEDLIRILHQTVPDRELPWEAV